MKRKRVIFKSKEQRDIQSAAAFLRQLADRLEQNELILHQGAQEARVAVPDNVVLALKVKEKAKKRRTRQRLNIALKWTEGDTAGGAVTLG